MEETKREVLDLLLGDARLHMSEIADMTGLDEPRVENLIDDLEEEGVIRGYQAIVDWGRVDNERVIAEVEVNVTLDRETSYDDISTRISRFPEVKSLKLVSGNYDFALEVEGNSMNEVSKFISEKIAPIPEITQTVTHFVMDIYKDRGIEMKDGHDDDRLSVSP